MHCRLCNTNYGLYTYYGNRKGITETYYGWVPKSLLCELAELRERIEKEKRGLESDMKARYGEKWRQHFTGKKKKAIWSELTQDGRTYPSLSTFYSHVRNSGLARALEEYLAYREVETVIRVLGLNDAELSSMIERIQELEQATELKEQYVRQKAFA